MTTPAPPTLPIQESLVHSNVTAAVTVLKTGQISVLHEHLAGAALPPPILAS